MPSSKLERAWIAGRAPLEYHTAGREVTPVTPQPEWEPPPRAVLQAVFHPERAKPAGKNTGNEDSGTDQPPQRREIQVFQPRFSLL